MLQVDGARRQTRGVAAVLIAAATLAVAMFGGPYFYSAIASASSGGPGLDRLLQYACVLGPLYLVAIGLLAYEGRAKIAPNAGPLISAPVGLALGLAGLGLAVAMAELFGVVRPGESGPPLSHGLIGVAIMTLLIAFQSFGEELFFRGWLQPVLVTRWGPWVGLLTTAALFAAAHAIGRPIGPMALLNDALAGVVFGLLALRTGGLAAPFAAHLGWNWAEAVLLGLTPNPGVDELGAFFDLDLAGPAFLSGGGDELNGAISTTVALLLMMGAALLWRPAKE